MTNPCYLKELKSNIVEFKIIFIEYTEFYLICNPIKNSLINIRDLLSTQ